jgi:D-alanine-D-alanine ligase-like ATP-grasp enzyme
MTAESIIPKQAEAAGIEISELYSLVIEDMFNAAKT